MEHDRPSPRAGKNTLIQRFVGGVELSGWNVLVLAGGHPCKMAMIRGEERHVVLLYIWNMTYGGHPRNADELRIQITGTRFFTEAPGMKTLVLGWSEEERMFAGFDVTKHRTLGRSPSFQVKRQTLDAAKSCGISPQEKGNDEIAIAFRPDFAAAYVQELEGLHQSASRQDLSTLQAIIRTTDEPVVREMPAGPRRTVLQQVQRRIRDARFRSNIMAVYGSRCAMSDIQLGLLDAAHIIPVEHARGTDEIRNGLCLSAIHHRAFDTGLVGIRADYRIVFNERKLHQLRAIGWDGGVDTFKRTLRDRINLPATEAHYPSPEYLLLGQTLRGWLERQLVG
jgi:putative restriction endonuclease